MNMDKLVALCGDILEQMSQAAWDFARVGMVEEFDSLTAREKELTETAFKAGWAKGIGDAPEYALQAMRRGIKEQEML